MELEQISLSPRDSLLNGWRITVTESDVIILSVTCMNIKPGINEFKFITFHIYASWCKK